MADLSEITADNLDDLDIEELLARVESKSLTFSRTKSLNQAPEFSKRLSGEDTVDEGCLEASLECKVDGFPRPELFWYKDAELIHPDHPRMRVEELDGGVYVLTIKNVTKGDEAGYKCKAINVEGETSSTFFLFVKVKPKKGGKRGKKRRRVSYPPMFATIVEKVEEEERAAKEARYAPPSPLSELYVGITLKSRHTWPKFLGEWAFAEDTIRSCSDETESPPTSPDNEMDHDGTKIKVKVKVNERTSKPVKSILKTRRRGEESQTPAEPTGKGREGGDPGKPPASAASNNKKTTTDSKTATSQTESRTTTTKTNTTTSKSNVLPKTAESGQSDQSWIRKKQPPPGQVVSERSESKTTSEDSRTSTTESKTTTVTGNGTKTQTTSSTSTTTTTTKSTTRSLTSHRVEEPKQTQSPAESKSAPNTSSAAPKTLPSPGSSPKTTKPAGAAKTEEESKKPTDNGKSKTQALQERLIQKTNKSNGKNNDGSAPKMISTGSLGISKLTEQLNARASPGREVSPRKSPMKEVPKKDKSPSEDSSVKTPPQSSATPSVKNQVKSDASTPPVKENGAQSAKTPVTPTTSSSEIKSPANTLTKSGATSPQPLNGQTTTKALSSTEKLATATTTTTTTPSIQASSKSASQTPNTAKTQAVTNAKTPVTSTSSQRPTSLAPLVSTAGSKEQANGKKLEHIKIVKSPTPSPVATAKTPTGSSVKTPVAATAGAPVNGKTALKTSSDNVTTSKPSATIAKTPSSPTVTSLAAKTNGSINQSKSSVSANSSAISQTAASPNRSNQKPLTPSMENQPSQDTSDSSRKQSTSVPKKLESPVTQQKIPVHNMALPGKPKPEASGGKSYKVETVLRTTGQSPVPRTGSATTSPAASTSNTTPSSERKPSLGMTVVNKLVIDPKNAERPESPQSFAGQRGKSPVTIHRVRSRETSPATPERRVRMRERGKSPVIQLLPTTPANSRPATPGVCPPSPVRYLPIISVKERPTEKLIVQQPNPSSIIDLRGLGEPRTGLESGALQHASNEPVHLIHNEMRTQPIELHRPFGSGKDPEQGMKQTFSTQEIQAHQDESHVHDPRAGIKRSISTEKLYILEKNTDVLSGERLGAVGAKSEVIGTDVTRTHLITERPAVPSQNVQPGQVPVQAMQREILTKENVHKSVMEVAKPDLPKGTVVVEKPGAAVVMRKSFAIDGSLGSSSSSSSEIGSPPSVPSSLAASRNSSRSPSPIRMRPLDYVRDQTQAAQSRVKTSMALNFNQIDPRQSQGQGGTPEVTGQGWYQRPGPVPPRRSSSVDRMMSHQHFSAPTSPMGESPATRRKTSLSFTPFFARTEVKGPVDIKQYLGEGGKAQMDRSRRCQSVERLPTAWYPSQAAVPQYQHQKVYSTRPPTLQRSVSVDVVPSLFGSDSGSYRTFQEIPVQHQVSDSSATLPRRRHRRNSVELMTEMFDAGAPPQAQATRGDPGNRSMEAALQYPEMGQQLLSQIQSLGKESYAFEEGSATLPRGGKDSREPSRLKRRNSVGHMAKIFDQGRPVIAKDEDTDIASPLTAPINIVHPFHQRDEQVHQVGHPQGSLASSRLSASQPHLPGTHSNNSNTKYGQPRLNRAGNGQANSSRAAACSLNLQNLQKPGHSDPPPDSAKPVLRRSLSEKAKSPNGRQPPTIQSQVSMQEDESKQYKRLSVGDAARMFDQKLNPEPPQPKRAGGLNLASKAQKFLSRFK